MVDMKEEQQSLPQVIQVPHTNFESSTLIIRHQEFNNVNEGDSNQI
jgi:hypothetical protein